MSCCVEKRREPRSHPTTPGRGGMRNLISSRFTVLCKHRRRRSSSRRPSSRQESVHSLSCDRPQKGERRGLVRSPQSADGRRPARADGRRAPGRRRRWQPQRPRRHRARRTARDCPCPVSPVHTATSRLTRLTCKSLARALDFLQARTPPDVKHPPPLVSTMVNCTCRAAAPLAAARDPPLLTPVSWRGAFTAHTHKPCMDMCHRMRLVHDACTRVVDGWGRS